MNIDDARKKFSRGESEPRPSREGPKVPCQLAGMDGNIFAVMGRAANALRRESMGAAAKEMMTRVTSEAEDYTEALRIIQEYVYHQDA